MLNYYPKHFRRANTVILKKPLKEEIIYTNPKIYRLIILLSILDKVLKKLYTLKIKDITKDKKLLPKQQIEARKKRLIELVLEILIDTIYIVFRYSK